MNSAIFLPDSSEKVSLKNFLMSIMGKNDRRL